MHFALDKALGVGTDESGLYSVAARGERYGIVFTISRADGTPLELWARRAVRPPHEHELKLWQGADVRSVIEWVIDNRAGTGAPLLTLEQRLSDYSLGDLMRAFLHAYEAAQRPEWDSASEPLKVDCRGNQRGMMESRFGP